MDSEKSGEKEAFQERCFKDIAGSGAGFGKSGGLWRGRQPGYDMDKEPLIFCSVALGLADFGDIRIFGRIAMKLAVFLLLPMCLRLW